jgi:hypothetical protein
MVDSSVKSTPLSARPPKIFVREYMLAQQNRLRAARFPRMAHVNVALPMGSVVKPRPKLSDALLRDTKRDWEAEKRKKYATCISQAPLTPSILRHDVVGNAQESAEKDTPYLTYHVRACRVMEGMQDGLDGI